MANKEHTFADILVAIAAGEDIQWRPSPMDNFRTQISRTTLRDIADEVYSVDCYRVAPNVNSAGIPRPLAAKPFYGDTYYYWEIHAEKGYSEDSWDAYTTDENRYASRLIWATEDDAKAAVDAIRALMNS